MDLKIDAMHCGGCVRGVEAAIREADAAARVTIDLDTRRAQVETDRPEAVLAALSEAGFPAVPA